MENKETTEFSKIISFNTRICYSTAFLVYVSSATLIPSLWPYLQSLNASKAFLGWCISTFSFGQIVGGPLLGFWHNKRNPKEVLITGLLLLIIGDFIYALSPHKYAILFSRLISGLGSGIQAVAQAYLSSISSVSERSTKLANFQFASSLSFIFGPAISFLLSLFSFKVLWVKVNSFTAPGFFSGIVAIVNLVLVIIFFKVHPRIVSQESKSAENENLLDETKYSPSSLWALLTSTRIMPALVIVNLIVFFFLTTCLSVYETISTPLTTDEYKWEGTVSAIGYGLLTLITRHHLISDLRILISSNIMLICGFIFMIEVNNRVSLWRYIVGTIIVAFNFPIGQTTSLAVYSKLLGSIAQGTMLGVLMTSGAIARLIGPIWATYLYELKGEAPVFGVTAIGLLIALSLVIISYKEMTKRIDIDQTPSI